MAELNAVQSAENLAGSTTVLKEQPHKPIYYHFFETFEWIHSSGKSTNIHWSHKHHSYS
jgi:hypothetical protein